MSITEQLADAARLVAASLTKQITQANCMTPQAVMVRQLNDALVAFDESKRTPTEPCGAHTAEPWHVGQLHPEMRQRGCGDLFAVFKQSALAPFVQQTLAENVEEADARRIVACVNACAGIPTETLETHGVAP